MFFWANPILGVFKSTHLLSSSWKSHDVFVCFPWPGHDPKQMSEDPTPAIHASTARARDRAFSSTELMTFNS